MIHKDSDNHNTVTSNQSPLWQRILAFSLDQAGTEIPFSRRVARENGWSTDYTQRVIEEYKRFAFLATVAGHLVTPSDPVDQVWHLHLTYSRSYWEDFCPHVLGKALHHDPTRGGWAEQDKFREWYRQTLASYERLLGHAAPADIWPAPEIRFCGDAQFVRINRADYWIVPKPGAQTIPRRIELRPMLRNQDAVSRRLLFPIMRTLPRSVDASAAGAVGGAVVAEGSRVRRLSPFCGCSVRSPWNVEEISYEKNCVSCLGDLDIRMYIIRPGRENAA